MNLSLGNFFWKSTKRSFATEEKYFVLTISVCIGSGPSVLSHRIPTVYQPIKVIVVIVYPGTEMSLEWTIIWQSKSQLSKIRHFSLLCCFYPWGGARSVSTVSWHFSSYYLKLMCVDMERIEYQLKFTSTHKKHSTTTKVWGIKLGSCVWISE